MRNTLTFIKSHLAEIVIVVVTVLLSFVNYRQNTTLTGWDNLHPEYNLSLNISRSLSAVWQEYQGVGLVGGMAHAADLPRQLLLIPLEVLLPVQMIRYVSTFTYLIVGPLGAYYLFKFLLKDKKWAAFIGALFYVLNLSTVQTFYVPYESFVAFFGFLPWFLLSIVSYLETPKRKEKIVLIVIFLLGSTAFYVQTLFIVLMLIAAFFIVNNILRNHKKGIQSSLSVLVHITTATAFWLLPIVYFTATNIQVVSQNKINAIATVETQYMNQSFGNISDIALLKGFWTNYIDAQGSGYGFLMNDWHTFLNSSITQTSGYLLFSLVLAGVFGVFLIRKKLRYPFVFPLLLLFCILMLSSGNGTIGSIFSVVADKIPFFAQIFRSSFTKWSTVTSLLFGWGIGITITVFQEKSPVLKKIIPSLFGLISIIAMVITVYPAFQGKFISDNMRLKVPSEYQSLFSYLKTQPKEMRIAVLPSQQIWGWDFYDWGYRGSGFLWYGIEQPVLDRAFDVWSHENENFYQEFEYAWYRENSNEITTVLTKYQVPLVLLDRSVQIPTSPNKDSLGLTKATETLEKAGYKNLWKQGTLELYKNDHLSESFVTSVKNPQRINTVDWGKFDSAYKINGDYILDPLGTQFLFPKSTAEIVKPQFKTDLMGHEFATFTAEKSTLKQTVSIPSLTGFISLSGFITYSDQTITIQFLDPYTVFDNSHHVFSQTLKPLYIETASHLAKVAIQLGGQVFYVSQNEKKSFQGISVDLEKSLTVEVFNAEQKRTISLSDAFLSSKMNTCWERVPNEGRVEQQFRDGILTVSTQNAVGCASYKVGVYPGNKHLLSISVPFESPNRARPDFCLVVEGTSTCLHDEVFYNSETSTTWKDETREVLVDASKTYWLVLSARPSDVPDAIWDINYKAPSVDIMSNIAEFEIKTSYWQDLVKPHQIFLGNGMHVVSVQFPVSSSVFSPDFSGRGGTYNCDIFKRGTVDRTTKGSSVTFQASGDGISCDYRLLANITQEREYLLRIQGETNEGRGPKIYLYNEATKKNDIEALLTGSVFDTTFSVLSQTDTSKSNKEFTINYETRSFGSIGAENTIHQVKVYPFNLSWLGLWNVGSVFSTQTSVESELSSTKILTFLYSISTPQLSQGEYVKLSQAYNPGWIAISSSGILPHTRMNGWENAWQFTSSAHTSIIILYWPQILEFSGILFLCINLWRKQN